MASEIEIRPLRREDDRSTFSCGQSDLDRFFHHYAGQNQFRLRASVTYVACAGGHLAGFATVVSASVERRTVPDDKLRRRLPAYPLPALRLARLAVDRRVQGPGIAAALLHHVLLLALDQRDRTGCVAIVADAKPEAVSFYQHYGFVPIEGDIEGLLHSEPTPMFLPLAAVDKVLGT